MAQIVPMPYTLHVCTGESNTKRKTKQNKTSEKITFVRLLL